MSGTSSFLARHFSYQSFTGNTMKEINGNTIVWRHIREQNRLMTLDPLGYDSSMDVDEIYSRHRRKTKKGTHGTKGRTTGETQ